jgi:photosystem II stability/assembly factor-like uncharacterized protein
VYDVLLDDTVFYVSSWGDTGVVYRSEDYGAHWDSVFSSTYFPSLLGTLEHVAYITDNTFLYRRNESLEQWDKIDLGTNLVFARMITHDSTLFLGTLYGGLLRSDDSGTTWQRLNFFSGRYSYFSIRDSTMFADWGGLFRSTDMGRHWSASLPQLVWPTIEYMAGNRPSAIFALSSCGLNKTTDVGEHWSLIESSDSAGSLFATAVTYGLEMDDDTLYAATSKGLIRSIDGGRHFEFVLSEGAVISHLVIHDGKIFANTSKKFYRSADHGKTWDSTAISGIKGMAADGDQMVYVSTNKKNPTTGVVLRSRNGGVTWDTTNLQSSYVYFIGSTGGNIFASTIDGMYYSNDSGAHWNLSQGLQKTKWGIFKSIGKCIVFSNGTSYISRDSGKTFQKLMQVPQGLSIHSMLVFDSLVVAGCAYDGVWTTTPDVLLDVKNPFAGATPRQFLLMNNYPNPFNPQTTIAYELPERSRIRLAIYNLLGQEISVLEQKIAEAGHRTTVWDASRMPSGVYFYRLDAASVSDPSKRYSETKKMIFIK